MLNNIRRIHNNWNKYELYAWEITNLKREFLFAFLWKHKLTERKCIQISDWSNGIISEHPLMYELPGRYPTWKFSRLYICKAEITAETGITSWTASPKQKLIKSNPTWLRCMHQLKIM